MDGIPMFIIPVFSPIRTSMLTATTASFGDRMRSSCGSVSCDVMVNSIGVTECQAVFRSCSVMRKIPSITLCSISVISRSIFSGVRALPPKSISMIGKTSPGLISSTALLSNGFIPSDARHVGEGRHCENSMNESCSTETRLTATYARRYAERLEARLREKFSCSKWIARSWSLAIRSGRRKS